MARAISLRVWRTTTAAKIQAVGSSHPPSFAAFSRDAAALWAMYPAMSPDLAAKSAAAAQLSRSALHSYHVTGVYIKEQSKQPPILKQGKVITSNATSVSTHRDPMNIFFVLFYLCYKTTDLCNKTLSISGYSIYLYHWPRFKFQVKPTLFPL
jgi:hypothetical protein